MPATAEEPAQNTVQEPAAPVEQPQQKTAEAETEKITEPEIPQEPVQAEAEKLEIPEKTEELSESVPEEPAVKDLQPESVTAQETAVPDKNSTPVQPVVKEPAVQELKKVPSPAPSPVPVSAAAAKTASAVPTKPQIKSVPAKKTEQPKPAAAKTSSEQEKDTEPAAEKKPAIMPSRSVTLKKNQYLDITYPGSGWIYLGEAAPRSEADTVSATENIHFAFFGRNLGKENTVFTLRARTPGTVLLHFYKNDTLTGRYIDDYLEAVITDETAASAEHIAAPLYADSIPVKPARIRNSTADTSAYSDTPAAVSTVPSVSSPSAGIQQPAQQSTVSTQNTSGMQDASSTLQPSKTADTVTADTAAMSSDDILAAAQKAYDAKQYVQSYTLLNSFFDKAASRIDEGLYLLGQTLEKKSSVQNIKNAIQAYDTLTKDWPGSTLWQKASERSIYLKRFYINIQ